MHKTHAVDTSTNVHGCMHAHAHTHTNVSIHTFCAFSYTCAKNTHPRQKTCSKPLKIKDSQVMLTTHILNPFFTVYMSLLLSFKKFNVHTGMNSYTDIYL